MSALLDRRRFLKRSTLATMTALLGADIVHAAQLPPAYLPLAFRSANPLAGKNEAMIVLNDRPWNVEMPPHALDEAVTTFPNIFVRNNGLIPTDVDAKNWTLTVGGESVRAEKIYSLNDLKNKFTAYTYQLVLECGGNGRAGFYPPAAGNQWQEGAVSCARWTGVRVRDLLDDVGVKDDAVYLGYYGTDRHLSGDPDKVVISRGVPLKKARQDETMLAWAMNGEDIPLAHGYPLRLVCGGWPASVSGKWVNRLVVRNQVHDGPKMGGNSYRVPRNPVSPGQEVADKDMVIIESMPVKSLITYPQTGAMFGHSRTLNVRGHAWAGERSVRTVEISTDFGATWQNSALRPPVNRLAWQQWTAAVRFPQPGYYEVWARATDSAGVSQPMVIPGWNPKGYLNNASHRIAVKVDQD